MNLAAELQYLHDKLVNVDIVKLNLYLLPSLRASIKTNLTHQGFKYDLEQSLGKVQDEARINRYGKCIDAQRKDIDIMYCANEFYYATLLTYNAVGTKQEANVAKFQGKRIEKAKKVLDLL